MEGNDLSGKPGGTGWIWALACVVAVLVFLSTVTTTGEYRSRVLSSQASPSTVVIPGGGAAGPAQASNDLYRAVQNPAVYLGKLITGAGRIVQSSSPRSFWLAPAGSSETMFAVLDPSVRSEAITAGRMVEVQAVLQPAGTPPAAANALPRGDHQQIASTPYLEIKRLSPASGPPGGFPLPQGPGQGPEGGEVQGGVGF